MNTDDAIKANAGDDDEATFGLEEAEDAYFDLEAAEEAYFDLEETEEAYFDPEETDKADFDPEEDNTIIGDDPAGSSDQASGLQQSIFQPETIVHVPSNVKKQNVFWQFLILVGAARTKEITATTSAMLMAESEDVRIGFLEGLDSSDGYKATEYGRRILVQSLESPRNPALASHLGILLLYRDIARSLGIKANASASWGKRSAWEGRPEAKRPSSTLPRLRRGTVATYGRRVADIKPFVAYKQFTDDEVEKFWPSPDRSLEQGFTIEPPPLDDNGGAVVERGYSIVLEPFEQDELASDAGEDSEKDELASDAGEDSENGDDDFLLANFAVASAYNQRDLF